MLSLLVLGCAPGPGSIASAGIDGLSYVATGKSLSDQAISQAADQNCSTWRVFAGRAICRDYTPEEQRENQLARARLDARDPAESRVTAPRYAGLREPSEPLDQAKPAEAGAGGDAQIAAAIRPQEASSLAAPRPAADATAPEASVDDGGVRVVAAPPPATAPVVAASRPAPAAGDRGLYLVLASFASRGNADRALAIYADAHPGIASVTVGGATLHRIIAGPFGADQLAAARGRVEKIYGIRYAWALPSCARDGASGCVTGPPAGRAADQLASLPAVH